MELFFLSCSGLAQEPVSKESQKDTPASESPASLGLVGDPSDVTTESQFGLTLMGGSRDVDAAIQWMMEHSGGGDIVVIRASGTDAYNHYMYNLGDVNSVETLKIDSRSLANDVATAQTIRNAEMLFIAGGDQSKYVSYWKNTETMEAINYLLNEKKVPVGGTSAGCAILGNFYFTGENGSAVSTEAISDPYNSKVTVFQDDFLQAPFLENIITDQHFSQREREGRLVVFLARILQDSQKYVYGIGVDEKTAVCIDEQGKAKVFGSNNAYFIATSPEKAPEEIASGTPLKWNHNGEAILTYKIPASQNGNGNFDVGRFSQTEASGGTYYWWSVQDNGLMVTPYSNQ